MPHGKICYLEIPAKDVDTSAEFYGEIFGWPLRTRGHGDRAFDDATGAVSGTWVTGRPPARDPGLMTYIMVDSIPATLKKIAASGGAVATPLTPIDDNSSFATFRDPAGNLLGLYQESRR
jgi:predicted enzyme related to lactoylglutathione lyase